MMIAPGLNLIYIKYPLEQAYELLRLYNITKAQQSKEEGEGEEV